MNMISSSLPKAVFVNVDTLQKYNLRLGLEQAGIEVITSDSYHDWLEIVSSAMPALFIVECGGNCRLGLHYCKEIRNRLGDNYFPILVVSLRADTEAKVSALDAGADDHITLPVSISEFVARVNVHIRRMHPDEVINVLSFENLRVNLPSHRVFLGSNEIKLGPTEYKLLCFLMKNPQKVISRSDLLDAIWGPRSPTDPRTVDVYVGRLRRALKFGAKSNLIRTVRSAGYILG